MKDQDIEQYQSDQNRLEPLSSEKQPGMWRDTPTQHEDGQKHPHDGLLEQVHKVSGQGRQRKTILDEDDEHTSNHYKMARPQQGRFEILVQHMSHGAQLAQTPSATAAERIQRAPQARHSTRIMRWCCG